MHNIAPEQVRVSLAPACANGRASAFDRLMAKSKHRRKGRRRTSARSYYYRVPRLACLLVRDFDDGKEVAPLTFTLRYSNREKIKPVAEERKAQVNAARRQRNEVLADQGLKPKTYVKGRYGL